MYIVSRKNLQEALGKDYTKEKVEEIMRVRIVYNAPRQSILYGCLTSKAQPLFYISLFCAIRHPTQTRMGKFRMQNFWRPFEIKHQEILSLLWILPMRRKLLVENMKVWCEYLFLYLILYLWSTSSLGVG